jgi:hypothetical protein
VVIKALLESPALKLSTLFYKVCFCLWEGFRKTIIFLWTMTLSHQFFGYLYTTSHFTSWYSKKHYNILMIRSCISSNLQKRQIFFDFRICQKVKKKAKCVPKESEEVEGIYYLKGSLTRDFRLQVFFMNQCPPGPQVFHWSHFEFFRKFAEIFAN